MVDQALFKSDKQDWNTPPKIIDLIRRLAPIGLDPCSNSGSVVGSRVCWDKKADGLSKPWGGFGLVFVNPPYGKGIKGEPGIIDWLSKCAYEATHGVELIALVPARTDTKWFQCYGFTSQRICFWRGRIKFTGGDSSAPFPSALLYWGPRSERFSEIFTDYGVINKTE